MKRHNSKTDELWSKHIEETKSKPDISGFMTINVGNTETMTSTSNEVSNVDNRRYVSNSHPNHDDDMIVKDDLLWAEVIEQVDSLETKKDISTPKRLKVTKVPQGNNASQVSPGEESPANQSSLAIDLCKKVHFAKEHKVIDDLDDDEVCIVNVVSAEKKIHHSNQNKATVSSSSKQSSDNVYCLKCNNLNVKCESFLYGRYASAVVLMQFNHSPTDMNPKKCTEVFSKAYNRALDFHYFQENKRLIKKAFYYPTACLMDDLEDVIYDIELLENKYMLGIEPFVRMKSSECDEMPNKSVEQETSSNENMKTVLCELCGLTKDHCHRELFHEYCHAHVERNHHIFPTGTNAEAAKKLYIKKYNSALNFHYFDKHGTVPLKSYQVPRNCLYECMIQTLNFVENEHMTYVNEISGMENAKEWRHVNMDLFGFEIDLD